MEIVRRRVAGIDVRKKIIWVAVRMPGEAPGQPVVTVRRFATFWRQLQKMASWLAELGITDAARESTGGYWWPVYHALARAGITAWVCNAAQMRGVPGRKTDLRDCQWIAGLHEHGLLRPSVIPAAEVAALGQRARYRKKLIEQRSSELQRLAEVLEDGGIKIDSVASALTTISARDMIEALIAGQPDPAVLARPARGVMRKKIPQLEMACDGRFAAAHGQMCRLHLGACDHLGAQIAELDQLIAEAAEPFPAIIARLMTVPGGRAAHRPGDRGRDRRGHDPLPPPCAAGRLGRAGARRQRVRRQAQAGRGAPGQPAPARGHGRSGLGRLPHRHPARRPVPPPRPPVGRGNEKKAVAVAHTLISIAWAVMRYDGDYHEAGADYYDRRDARNRDHLVRHHQQALARLGYQVTLIPPGDRSPPPAQAA